MRPGTPLRNGLRSPAPGQSLSFAILTELRPLLYCSPQLPSTPDLCPLASPFNPEPQRTAGCPALAFSGWLFGSLSSSSFYVDSVRPLRALCYLCGEFSCFFKTTASCLPPKIPLLEAASCPVYPEPRKGPRRVRFHVGFLFHESRLTNHALSSWSPGHWPLVASSSTISTCRAKSKSNSVSPTPNPSSVSFPN